MCVCVCVCVCVRVLVHECLPIELDTLWMVASSAFMEEDKSINMYRSKGRFRWGVTVTVNVKGSPITHNKHTHTHSHIKGSYSSTYVSLNLVSL